MFPVASINLLHKGMKPIQRPRFAYAAELIFYLVWEAIIKIVPEGAISITLDLGCKAIEVNNVSHDAMAVLHLEVVKLVLGISNWIVRTEGGVELRDKGYPAVHPAWVVVWVGGI